MEYSVDLLIISMSKEKEGVKLRSAGDASIFSVCSGVPPNVPPALTSRSPRRRAVDGFHRWPGTRSGAAGEKIPVSKTMGLKCKPGNVRSRTSAAAISCNRTAISIISAATTTGATRKSPLHVQCRGAVAMPYHDEMRPLPRPVSPTGRGADACAVARGGKLTRSRRPINPIPRHKRDSHINAEYRRRNKIQRGFEVVRTLVPVLREADPATRESKASMLNKCAAFIREVTEECRHQDEEAMSLRQEVDNLRKELESLCGTVCRLYQQQLPAAGISTFERPSWQAQDMLDDYFRQAILQDWRFWIFSHVVQPLFNSYTQHVTLGTADEFKHCVREWSDRYLNLVSLRPIVLSTLRGISTSTGIMSHPECLECEILDKVKDVKPVLPVSR
ncbi:carbohydrate-responsive element-binding protein-like isoform X2 [Pomacea canaliculata]|uniref:carbohydrate-responsive element-binding protein-like isoform X2 n=1 Tax=Pomacea canaliculata TaxID=400727 RepID=UPI000D72919D|nr:carbohydrate-responsive element-binding protein-like isoform X2 [Pomacea canaliculata]